VAETTKLQSPDEVKEKLNSSPFQNYGHATFSNQIPADVELSQIRQQNESGKGRSHKEK